VGAAETLHSAGRPAYQVERFWRGGPGAGYTQGVEVLDRPGSFHPTSRGDVFVRRWAGPPGSPRVLFVHGLGGEARDWAGVALALRAELAGQVDCYALDLPGFGESPPPEDGDLSLEAMAHTVVEIIATIADGDRPVHLVGNSLGGTLAVLVAARRPDAVATLTLVAPALPDLRPRRWSWELALALIGGVGPWLVRRALVDDPIRTAQRVIRACYGDPTRLTPRQRADVLDSIDRRAVLPYAVEVYRGALASLVRAYLEPRRGGVWQQARLVQAPTLLVYGGRDKLVDPRMAARAMAVFARATLVEVADAGHVVQLEFPVALAAELAALLRADPALPDPPLDVTDPPRGMLSTHGTVVASES
jgi:pimeloyl-ACP methyl ester carboxylesterase